MKKLKLNLQNIEGAEILTRAQLKNVLGGTSLPGNETTTRNPGTPGGDNGNPCPDNCTKYCSSTNYGTPDQENSTGACSSTATNCHNYCCESSNPSENYWC